MPFVAPNLLSRQYRSQVQPSEWVAILYCLGMMVLLAVFRARVPSWLQYFVGHGLILTSLYFLIGATSPAGKRCRAFDMAVYIPVFFFMICPLIHRIHPVDYDAQLIAADRAIGGIDLLRRMAAMETPALTQIAKWAWISYYVVAFIPAIPLYRRATSQAFEEAKLIFMMGWLISYAAYFAVPAEGPGYHAEEIGVPQPRWEGSTSTIKQLIHRLEGDARDTFPSGHVIIAALTIFVCFRNKLWVASLLGIPVALAIIGSTLYLRYHYLVDVLAGLVVAVLCAGVGVWWYRRYDEGRIG